jgi:hypothetical protein
MKWLKALIGGEGGGLIGKGLEFINERWPPDMSEQQRRQMEVVVKDMLHRQEMEIANAMREDEKLFNERTIAMEGTASDLKSIPVVGAVVIFLRGAFRPAFSYMTAYIDWLYFSTNTAYWTDQQQTLLLTMNLLVLIFFFGERAIKNVMPAILQVFTGSRASVQP